MDDAAPASAKPRRSRGGRGRRKGAGDGACRSCGEKGHFARDCPSGGQKQQQSNSSAAQNGGGKEKASLPPPPPPQQQAVPMQIVNPNSRTSSTTLGQLTDVRFADAPLAVGTQRALAEVLGYERMTRVQAQTLPVSLQGKDVLAKAKTGTGKTLGFLLPAIERILAAPAAARRGRVSALVISPTRELAQQIAEEGLQLLKFHDLGLQVVFGGTKMTKDVSSFNRRTPDILVATPGRLLDHLENTPGFREACAGLQCLILDECDQLLDMGFRPSIVKILQHLPPKSGRQTLLFSATMPQDVQEMARFGLNPSYELVDCVGKEAGTHQQVPQTFLVCSVEDQLGELAQIIAEGRQVPGHKLIVFFTTARLTQFYAEVFNFMGVPVLEIHSRKSQGHRTKVSDQFRTGNGLVMFTSDVSARGMDYPDVTGVIQVGMPADRAQYVHRLGRTARAGGREGGRGVLLLAEFERPYLRQLSDLPLQPRAPSPPEALAAQGPQLSAALARLSHATRGAAYQAWMGFYNSNLRRCNWSKEDLVRNANHWITAVCEAPEVPALQAKTIGKMGLKNVPGLIKSTEPFGGGRGGGGNRGDQNGSSQNKRQERSASATPVANTKKGRGAENDTYGVGYNWGSASGGGGGRGGGRGDRGRGAGGRGNFRGGRGGGRRR